MLSRFSDVLQTAADVLAPPATKLEDFEYHWKMVVKFYQNYGESAKIHVENTKVPHHLHQMLQLIVDEEKEQQGGTVGPCLEAIVKRSIGLLDALVAIAATDRPPGGRAMALSLATALLRRTRQPCINSPHVYRPLQKMLVQCNESPASPTEKEEVELLLTLCGLVRKEPGLANIFTTPFLEDKASLLSIPEDIQKIIPIKKTQTPKKNKLFEVDMASKVNAVSIVRLSDGVSGCSIADDNDSSRSQKTVYDDNDKFLLIDLLLSYLNSADNQVVLRACEGILIVSSLAEEGVAGLVAGSPACEALVAGLAARLRAVPLDLDPAHVDSRDVTWPYVGQVFGDKSTNRFHGYRELVSFFSWLDYCDTLMKECHPIIASHLARTFRAHFLETAADALVPHSPHWHDPPGPRGPRDPAGLAGDPRMWFPQRALLTTAILARCLRVIDSPDLINEFSTWLVGEGGEGCGGGCGEGCGGGCGEGCGVALSLVQACLAGHHRLTLETLTFFEAMLEKGTEHSMDRLVLSRVCSRAYWLGGVGGIPIPGGGPGGLGGDEDISLQDERDRLNDLSFSRERERSKEALAQHTHEAEVGAAVSALLHQQGVEPHDHVYAIVNSFLLLLPRGVLSEPLGADLHHYVHDAHRHYQLWLDITSSYNWPSPGDDHSCDSRPEADHHHHHFDTLHQHIDDNRYRIDYNRYKIDGKHDSHSVQNRDDNEDFDEGPFLKMIFKLLSKMPEQPYQVNLHLTAIISKLALLPHPNLHEYLLDPFLPVSKSTVTLFKTLRELARTITVEVPKIKNYRRVIETTRQQLMSDDPSYDEIAEHNQLVESLIVLEEFCKELAAIAFVKHQHRRLTHAPPC